MWEFRGGSYKGDGRRDLYEGAMKEVRGGRMKLRGRIGAMRELGGGSYEGAERELAGGRMELRGRLEI